ncbi:MAG TPA: DUF2442 domain-containing protein [Saprospiraceae bacterium]|nr:DUF2442 domain-containing protein [Saprospiraceae bacterium]
MKIVVDYIETDIQNLKIIAANYIGDYFINILFNDGSKKIVDFKAFLSKSLHPSIKKYLNVDSFSEFKIVDANLNWNDYDLIFPIWDLYKGKIE